MKVQAKHGHHDSRGGRGVWNGGGGEQGSALDIGQTDYLVVNGLWPVILRQFIEFRVLYDRYHSTSQVCNMELLS